MGGLAALIDERELVTLVQKMIQTPSLTTEEEAIAALLANEMERLGFSPVQVDEQYNVFGYINPQGRPMLMFNGHIDHAGVGDMPQPFSGEIQDGSVFGTPGPVIYGRGGCDMKAAVAAMIHAAAALAKSQRTPRGGVVVTAVALEERNGEGTSYVLDHDGVKGDLAVSGEATDLGVYIGHRGKYNVKVTVKGKTSHASNPESGINAIYKMQEFLARLRREYELPSHPWLGDCTYSVVDIMASPGWVSPIVPDRCSIIIDRRILPGESKEKILGEFDTLIARHKEQDPQFEAETEIVTYTLPMFTDPQAPVVESMLHAREKVLGSRGSLGTWQFGTDAPYIMERGIPCVGFGPGDERFAHTPEEHVPVDDVIQAARVYAQLIEDICL